MTVPRLQARGLIQAQRVLQAIVDHNNSYLSAGITAALVHAYSKVSPYPPAPPDSTYQRGTDPRSEQMSKQWGYTGSGLKQSLVNRASYSGYVHGSRQPSFHKRTGWRTMPQTLKDESPEMARIITTTYIKGVRQSS